MRLLSLVLIPTIDQPGQVQPPGQIGADVNRVLGWVMWLAVTACVAGIIITAARMAIAHRRGGDSDVAQLGWVLGACVLIGSAAFIVNQLV
jgi:hypothetical protein